MRALSQVARLRHEAAGEGAVCKDAKTGSVSPSLLGPR
jgi:hypothetical protein